MYIYIYIYAEHTARNLIVVFGYRVLKNISDSVLAILTVNGMFLYITAEHQLLIRTYVHKDYVEVEHRVRFNI